MAMFNCYVSSPEGKYTVLVQKWDMDTSKFSTSLSSSPMNIWPFWCIFVIFETWLKEPTIEKLISFDHVPTFPKMFCSVWVLPCSNFSSSSTVLIHFFFDCNETSLSRRIAGTHSFITRNGAQHITL